MPYCSSCGEYIPDGQGSSCSMCYGDINYGSDGYYQQWAEEQMRIEAEAQAERELYEQQWVEEQQMLEQMRYDQEQFEREEYERQIREEE